MEQSAFFAFDLASPWLRSPFNEKKKLKKKLISQYRLRGASLRNSSSSIHSIIIINLWPLE